mgnify:CR=1 FL=1
MADETRRSSGHSEYGAAPRSASYGTHNDISQNGDSARIDFTQIVKDTLRAFISNWWLFILIAAVLCCRAPAQTLPAPYRFRVMSYNVEHLFDCRHASLTCDNDVLPHGAYVWTHTR